jgi:uncharacterized protein YndB with AHSA1/START domain
MTTTHTTVTTQVHRIWINAAPQAVWDAIIDPDWNSRYGYGAPSEYELRPGGAYRVLPTAEMLEYGSPNPMIEGEVLEIDPPHRLIQTWHALFDEATTAEPPQRLTWELVEQHGATRLTVTHELADAPATAVFTSGNAENAGGGWPHILSDLKTLLETGTNMQGHS